MSVGFLKLGKFIRLVPHSVMLGFVNGLAIVIFLAQFPMLGAKIGDTFHYYEGAKMAIMLGLIALTMAIMFLLPKLTKAVPSALVAIIVVIGIAYFLNLDTPNVNTLLDGNPMNGGLPSLFLDYPEGFFSWETFKIILLPAISVAGVGLIESLLTLTLIDEKTDTRGSGNRESVAQGLANFISGAFGSMGGCAMIGQSMININSGARKRLSGIVASVALLMFIMFFSEYIKQIPVAGLVGIMFMVAYGTFEWHTITSFNKIPKMDFFIMVSVAVITLIFHNLALAVLIGVILAALSFAWENAMMIRARKTMLNDSTKLYEIYGPLFFASTTSFAQKFEPHKDPKNIVVDFGESRIADQSAIEAIRKLNDRYKLNGQNIVFRGLSEDCILLLDTANITFEVNSAKDPNYKVVYN